MDWYTRRLRVLGFCNAGRNGRRLASSLARAREAVERLPPNPGTIRPLTGGAKGLLTMSFSMPQALVAMWATHGALASIGTGVVVNLVMGSLAAAAIVTLEEASTPERRPHWARFFWPVSVGAVAAVLMAVAVGLQLATGLLLAVLGGGTLVCASARLHREAIARYWAAALPELGPRLEQSLERCERECSDWRIEGRTQYLDRWERELIAATTDQDEEHAPPAVPQPSEPLPTQLHRTSTCGENHAQCH